MYICIWLPQSFSSILGFLNLHSSSIVSKRLPFQVGLRRPGLGTGAAHAGLGAGVAAQRACLAVTVTVTLTGHDTQSFTIHII